MILVTAAAIAAWCVPSCMEVFHGYATGGLVGISARCHFSCLRRRRWHVPENEAGHLGDLLTRLCEAEARNVLASFLGQVPLPCKSVRTTQASTSGMVNERESAETARVWFNSCAKFGRTRMSQRCASRPFAEASFRPPKCDDTSLLRQSLAVDLPAFQNALATTLENTGTVYGILGRTRKWRRVLARPLQRRLQLGSLPCSAMRH
mmetsp:Transcript_115840/g.327750  ORF Transcript_115840/g.327750 Transcript_115840/m.327750 type:complete len:206 (+) Transcript_115840:612-1229(+)